MKKLLLLSALLIFACSSELFCQDYMKMNKKNLRIEYQKKLNQIDSLKQVLDLTYSKNQNLQSNLNSANNDLLSISDSLKNSNLEISQLEAKLLNSKNELSQLGLEIDNLVKQNSGYLGLITDKNLQIDSLRTSLNIASDEKSDLISQNSLKAITIDSLKNENNDLKDKLADEYLSKEYFKGLKGMIEVRGKKIDEDWFIDSHFVSFLVEKSIEKDLIGKEITIMLSAGSDCDNTSRFEQSFKGKGGTGFDTSDETDFGMPCDPEYGDNCNFQLFIKQVEYICYDLDGEDYEMEVFEAVIINQL